MGGQLRKHYKTSFYVHFVRVFTEYLITLGHLLRTNRLRAYNL